MECQHPWGESGKLTAAAEHWFSSGGPVNKELIEDAEAYGLELEPEMLAGADFGVWEENWDAVMLFLQCQTQWRPGPRYPIGMDYSAVLDVATLYVPDSAERQRVFEEVQIIERRILELFKEKADQESN